MPRRGFSPFGRGQLASALRALLFLYFVWEVVNCVSIAFHQSAALSAPPPPPNHQRIYIAAQHRNSAPLLRSDWNPALLALVQELGIDNVFVSIVGSGSLDDTHDALRELDAELGVLQVERNVSLSNVTHADALKVSPYVQSGWIRASHGGEFLRRIPLLATTRNDALLPLEILTERGHNFDTILFLEDVVFSPNDVLRLLDTNRGRYAAACSVDFAEPPRINGTFALRDYDGHGVVMQTWPYFRSYVSRYAAEKFKPIPVASCWNGIVAMPIKAFVGNPPRVSPLRFRAIDDSLASLHLEASETCLIHADNPLSRSRGIFLNPRVKVGHDGVSYQLANSPFTIKRPFAIFFSVWKSRLLRWCTSTGSKDMELRKKLQGWSHKTGKREYAHFCLEDEMQVITEGGWEHVAAH